MVDRAGPPVEQSLTSPSKADSKDPNGCLKNRMGGSMPGNLHRRPMDTTGDAIPHQLSRTTSRLPGNPDLCQESKGHNDSHSDRQCTSNVIYQSEGWDPLSLTNAVGQDSMVMVHGKEHSPPSLGGAILCQPTGGLDTSGPDTGLNTEGQYSIDCPSVEDTGMVPITIAAPVRLPDINTSQRHDNTPSQPAPITGSGMGSTVGRMAYIGKSCEAGNLSDEATWLLMASWRSKSHSSYNSLFHKWECWCSQRKRNPIFGPVEDVANFLAHLFEKGYSYSSLNSYHSVSSSVHEHAKGAPVGQHPTVTRVLRGAYNIRPPRPRYQATWRVAQVA